ncbi:MAG: ATP-binding cassette domain-containing protein [Sulfuricurvum sp.]|uniref:ATP-binding cassette domain-containing protein n=1 Tax=Sulfuricurvum sp. TaxID=2025608 RepID=UPI0026333AA8|nr:ATP-binding cassette domain-containing protein [Sulfuricurvum sp.]MDD2828754.1 ATP-binding cassette domain-containing protein [Sulfuricurvum sp.]
MNNPQIQWLLEESMLVKISGHHLPQHTKAVLQEQTLSKAFYKKLLETFGLEAPLWQKELSSSMLPMLAFLPGGEAEIVFAQESNNHWSVESFHVIDSREKFPDGTLFTPLKLRKQTGKFSTAKEMFKNVAYQQKSFLIYAAIASLTINLLALGTSFYSMQVYDRVIPTQGISTLIALSIGVFIAIFLEMMVKISRSSILDHASKNMDIAYSHVIFQRLLKIRLDSMPRSIGTLSGQLQSYNAVRTFISSAAMYVLIDFPFSLLFLAGIMLVGGMKLGIIVIAFMVVSILVGSMFRHKIDQLSITSSKASHKKLGLLVETVEGAESIKATGSGWSALNRWNALTKDSIDDDIAIRHYSELSGYLSAFFQQLSYIALVAIGAYTVSTTNELTMGGLIAITILSGRVLSPISMIPNLFVQWGRAKISAKDLENIFSLRSDNHQIDHPLSPTIFTPSYVLNNIKFEYQENTPTVVLNSLIINAGEKVGIVGVIGSGKSTLLKLLAGLYAPNEGKVFLDGLDLQHLSREWLVKNIGYLPQSTKLFSGTIRDNLVLGVVGVSDEQITEACKKTGLMQLVSSLPHGLDSIIPESGESVSGGQKQLIALTRMVLAQPTIWLLDEPTASMDEGSEKRLIELLLTLMRPTDTLILVTHKPSLLRLVGRLIVMTPQGIAIDGPRDAVLQKISTPQGTPS